MKARIWAAIMLMLALLAGAALAEATENPPLVAEINPYVLELDDTAYITAEEFACYCRALDAIFARVEEIDLLPDYDANLHVFGALQNNPFFFLVEDTKFTRDHTALRVAYAYSAEEQQEMVDYVNGEYLAMFAEILEPDMSDLEKVLAVHHYFCQRIRYDYAYLEDLSLSSEKFLYPEIEVYQALKTGEGVCHSYTYLCEFALQQLGIDCLRLSAEMASGDSAHMWLAVRLDGEWYHVDPTWDSEIDYVSLRCFGMTDEERVAGGVVNEWNIDVDLAFGWIYCTSERFAPLHDIYDYRMLGGHKLQAWRIGALWPEIIDLRDI